MKSIMFPGSFDPIHEGHLKLIKKALNIFDEVIVVVTNNQNKNDQQEIEMRVNLAKEMTKNMENVRVMANTGILTVEFAKQNNINFLLRGIRNDTDYEYEYEMAKANKILNPNIETVFLFSEEEDRKISSSLLKEIKSFDK